ncbi:hypothetical protein FQN54_004567 [Arachnomyces sp. PD_36]|nr:hypothetical protein FQN54_004567 [Arachnomyces sp. PD_36]
MVGSLVCHGLTQAEAEQESVFQKFAGSNTTATAIQSTVSQLQGELDQAGKQGRVSSPMITYEEAKALTFLQACLKEGLRVWLPVVGLMRKIALSIGDYLRGQLIPGGTQIGLCAWEVHRNQEILGEDTELFPRPMAG